MNLYLNRFLVILIFLSFVSTLSAEDQNNLGLVESVRFALKNQPLVLLSEQQVESAKGEYQVQGAPFDYQISMSAGIAHDNTPLTGIGRAITDVPKVESDITNYAFNLSRQLRSGIVISPHIQMVRTEDNLFNNSSPNQASLSALLQFPLMKGRGTSSTGAFEKAAKHDYDASLLLQRQVVAGVVLDTTLAYWKYVAASQNLQIARESEARASKLMNQIQSLIEAQEVPASEMKQLQANLADKSVQVSEAEQNLIEARHALGLIMGKPAQEISVLPLPSDDFPSPPEGMKNPSSVDLVDLALNRRADLLAFRKREESSDVLQVAAAKDLRPALDLNVNFGYAGLNEGGGFSRLFSPFKDNVAGLNTSAFIQYSWPIQNSSAQGTLVQRNAEKKQASLETEDLVRKIVSAVQVACAAVQNSSLESKKAEEAVTAFQEALQNEIEKLRLGISTLLDLISMEDRLTNAQRSRNQARLRYASAVIQLRFETGDLIAPDATEVSIDGIRLIQPPQ
jgi:outer membrane protein